MDYTSESHRKMRKSEEAEEPYDEEGYTQDRLLRVLRGGAVELELGDYLLVN